MTDAFESFDNRLKKIGDSRAKLSQGYTSKVGRDGLIVFRPQRRRGSFPIKGLMLLAISFFCFKGFILAYLGEATYTSRVDTLASGSMVEQAGAFMMHADPVSLGIADYIRPFVK